MTPDGEAQSDIVVGHVLSRHGCEKESEKGWWVKRKGEAPWATGKQSVAAAGRGLELILVKVMISNVKMGKCSGAGSPSKILVGPTSLLKHAPPDHGGI